MYRHFLLCLILPLLLLPGAALSQGFGSAAQSKPEEFPRRVVVYVVGGISNDERTAIGSYMISSLINSGACVSHENFAPFIAAVIGEEQSKRQYVVDDRRISELGRHFGIKYVCMVTVTPISGVYKVSARMLNTQTERVKLRGEASGSMSTVDECWRISNTVVEKMLGRRKQEAQTASEPAFTATGGTARADAGGSDADRGSSGRHIGRTIFAVSLDVVGALAVAYGIFENNNAKGIVKDAKIISGKEYMKAEEAVKMRNAAYIAGAALLASGITIHIFF
jgi:hypothetical protein